jgi:Leucine-rich repeat (LRR) protein
MQTLHPLSFIPLPNLETIHLADNLVEAIPENLFLRLTQLRILNLARNRIRNLDALKWSMPGGLVLEQFHLESNPIRLGLASDSSVNWPLSRQLFVSNTNIQLLNSTHMVFQVCYYEVTSNYWHIFRTLPFAHRKHVELCA